MLGGGPGNFTVTGTHTYLQAATAAHPLPVTITMTDTDGLNPPAGTRAQLVASTTAVVAAAGVSVTAPSPLPKPTEGQAFSGLVGVIHDSNPNASVSDYTTGTGSITINWGDGSSAVTTLISPAGGGVFNVFGTHTYAEEGADSIKVTATNASGSVSSTTYSATVADAQIFGTSVAAQAGRKAATARQRDRGQPLRYRPRREEPGHLQHHRPVGRRPELARHRVVRVEHHVPGHLRRQGQPHLHRGGDPVPRRWS